MRRNYEGERYGGGISVGSIVSRISSFSGGVILGRAFWAVMVSYSLITGPRAAASCSAAPLLGEPSARIQKLNEPAEVMATPSGDLTPLANSGTLPLVVHDGVVPQDLLDESSDFLMSLLDAATTGKVYVALQQYSRYVCNLSCM